METEMQVSLESLKNLCEKCHACELAKTRTKMVYGKGNPHPDVLLVGEAPGKNEDLQGQPFVGAAGRTLDDLLSRCGINPSRIYIANVLKCRPPNNRNPMTYEIDACSRYLDAQIQLLRPKIIICLGAFATHHILKCDGPMYTLRGNFQKLNDGTYVMPTYHPAAAIYDRTKMPTIESDIRACKQMLDSMNAS